MEKEAIEEEGMVCGSSCQSSGPMTLPRRGGGAGATIAGRGRDVEHLLDLSLRVNTFIDYVL